MEVFTEEWSRACCEEMNRREAYRAKLNVSFKFED